MESGEPTTQPVVLSINISAAEPDKNKYHKRWLQKMKQNPEFVAKLNEKQRVRVKLDEIRAKEKQRYDNDLEYRERKRAQSREYSRRRREAAKALKAEIKATTDADAAEPGFLYDQHVM